MASSKIDIVAIPEGWKRLALNYDAQTFQGDFKRLASLGNDTDPAFTNFLTNKYWNHLSIQLGHWNPMNVIVMDHEMFNLMPDHTKLGVLRAMQHFLNEDAMYVRDPNNCQVLILGPRKTLEPDVTMLGETPVWDPKKKHVVPEPQGKLARPPNAYILYRKDHHEAVKLANPDLHNNDISVITGAMWKAESEAVRQKYQALADAIKKDFMEKNPEYRYNPRKSCDIRRRATSSNKNGTVAAGGRTRGGPISGSRGYVYNDIEELTAATSGGVRSQITDIIPGSQKFLNGSGGEPAWTPFEFLPPNSSNGFELSHEVATTETAVSSTVPISMTFTDVLGNGAGPATPVTQSDGWISLDDFDGSIEDLWGSMDA